MAPRYEEAEAIHYPGNRYVLGRAEGTYAVWNADGGEPIRRYPLTNEGWSQAYTEWWELEGPHAYVHPQYWQPGRPVPIRAMRFGQVFRSAWSLYGRNVLRLLSASTVFLAPYHTAVILLTMATLEVRPTVLPGLLLLQPAPWVNAAVFLSGTLVIAPFVTGTLVQLARDALLGREPRIGPAAGRALVRLPRMIVTVLPQAITLGIPFVLVYFATETTRTLGLVLLIPAIPVGFFFVVRLIFGPVAVVLENRGGPAAISRSWSLSRGRAWRILGAYLLALLGVLAVGLLVGFVAGAISAGSGLTRTTYLVSGILGAVSALVTFPFLALVVMLLYVDARVREEGFDDQRLAAESR